MQKHHTMLELPLPLPLPLEFSSYWYAPYTVGKQVIDNENAIFVSLVL